MRLRDWLASKWLVTHRTSRSEIGSLLDLADRDLADAEVTAVSTDWRHNIAYNAILRLAQAALAAAGYRASREQHHFRLIQSLALTVGIDSETARRLDMARKRRNRAAYDTAGLISEAEAEEVSVVARDLRLRVKEWLRKRYPDLM